MLRKVLAFIGVQQIADHDIKAAIDFSSFNGLRKAEQENRFKSGILSPGGMDDPESFKIRKGKILNYAEYLSSDDIEYINALSEKFPCRFMP